MTVMSGAFRIGRDGEVRFTGNSEPVMNLSLAYNYGKKGDDGNRPTQWIDAVIWGKRAESLEQFMRKGAVIDAVIEDVHIETFQKADGSGGHKLTGRIGVLEFVGGQRREEGADQHQEPARQASAPAQQSRPPQQRTAQHAGNLADMDDDIPF